MSLVRIGVIGCADIARRSMVPAILNLKDQYILSGVSSRTKEKAEEFASLFDTVPYTGYESLLNEAEIDAVYIPLPNSMHAEWIEKALTNNIHVLVEKSMACSYTEVKRLNKIASDKKLVLMENFQFRFHKQLPVINKMVKEGKIGELRCVRSSFGFPPFPDDNNIRYQKKLGGGALLDAGAYPIKIVQIYLGQDIEVSSANLWYDKEKGIDIWGGAYLNQKKSSLFAEIAFGFDNFYQCNLELWGSEGKIIAERIFTAPPDKSLEIIIESSKSNEVYHVTPCNHFENMLLYFCNLVDTKEDISAEYKQNINQSRLIFETMNIACNK